MAERLTTRRRLLRLSGVMAGVAGFTDRAGGSNNGSLDVDEISVDDSGTETTPLKNTPWPTFAYDAANTGFVPDGNGPSGPVEARWTADIGGSARPSGSESNPAVVDDTVYVGAGKEVNALDAATGEIRWQVTVGKLVDAGPAVDSDTVYIQDREGLVRALATEDGSERWSVAVGSRDLPIQQGSPTVVDGIVYVGSLEGVLYAFDAATGDVMWTFETDRRIGNTPAVVDGTVFVSSGDGNLYAIDAAEGTEVWHAEVPGGNSYSSPTVVDAVVYCGSSAIDDATVHAYDAANGANVWSVKPGDAVYSSPAVDGDTVYVGSIDNRVYALNATNGDERWSYQTDGKVYADPAVVGDAVYVGSYDDNVYALDATTGDEHWSFKTGHSVDAGAAVVDGTVYVGSVDGSVYALSSTGDEEDTAADRTTSTSRRTTSLTETSVTSTAPPPSTTSTGEGDAAFGSPAKSVGLLLAMGLGLVGLRYGIRMIRNGEGAQGGTETTNESEAGGRGEAETGGDSEGGSSKTREVQEGDTLWEINDDFGEPMTWESIAEVNDIEEPERVSEETEDDTDSD